MGKMDAATDGWALCFTFSWYCRREESSDWMRAVAWPMNMAQQVAPTIILSMVSHTSVIPSGAWAPYPIHNMWLMALNRAQEYCTPHVSFCERETDKGWGKAVLIKRHFNIELFLFLSEVTGAFSVHTPHRFRKYSRDHNM